MTTYPLMRVIAVSGPNPESNLTRALDLAHARRPATIYVSPATAAKTPSREGVTLIACRLRRDTDYGIAPKGDAAMFLGWYDPDRKRPARAKLADAIARYEEKFGRTPTLCLTSITEKELLDQPTLQHSGDLPLIVESRGFIARWTFYVGEGQSDA